MKIARDLTYRMESSGAPALTSPAEYIMNVAQRLFNMIPGTDDFNKDMGLNISSRMRMAMENGETDPDFESRIMKQFSTYTDIVPVSVHVIYHNKTANIIMDVAYNNQRFEMQLGPRAETDSPLSIRIQPKVIM